MPRMRRPKAATAPKKKAVVRHVAYKRNVVDAARVAEMLSLKVTEREVARRIGISEFLLVKHYRREINEADLAHGHSKHPNDLTRGRIMSAAALGLSRYKCAAVAEIAYETLKAHYEEDFVAGSAKGEYAVAKRLYERALSPKEGMPNTTSSIFYLKAAAGWKETERHEMTGKDGGPIESEGAVVILPSNGRDDLPLINGLPPPVADDKAGD